MPRCFGSDCRGNDSFIKTFTSHKLLYELRFLAQLSFVRNMLPRATATRSKMGTSWLYAIFMLLYNFCRFRFLAFFKRISDSYCYLFTRNRIWDRKRQLADISFFIFSPNGCFSFTTLIKFIYFHVIRRCLFHEAPSFLLTVRNNMLNNYTKTVAQTAIYTQ